MPADVVSLADARRRRDMAPRDPRSVQGEVRGELVVVLAPAREVPLKPAAARTLAFGLLRLADVADRGFAPSSRSLARALLEACGSPADAESLARELFNLAGGVDV